jgi:hypothetical protein
LNCSGRAMVRGSGSFMAALLSSFGLAFLTP